MEDTVCVHLETASNLQPPLANQPGNTYFSLVIRGCHSFASGSLVLCDNGIILYNKKAFTQITIGLPK